jgi:hypothetical protein
MGYPNAMRSAIVYAKWHGTSTTDISKQMGISVRTINGTWQRVINNGFDPNSPIFTLTDPMVTDSPRSGRPKKQTEDMQSTTLYSVATLPLRPSVPLNQNPAPRIEPRYEDFDDSRYVPVTATVMPNADCYRIPPIGGPISSKAPSPGKTDPTSNRPSSL